MKFFHSPLLYIMKATYHNYILYQNCLIFSLIALQSQKNGNFWNLADAYFETLPTP